MADTIFKSKGTLKRYQKIAKAKAALQSKESEAVKEFMTETPPNELMEIFKLIEEFGHPSEKNESRQLRTKYEECRVLDFDDVMTLDGLYKSSCISFQNKDDGNE